MQENMKIDLEKYRVSLDDIISFHVLDDSADGEYLSDPKLKNMFRSVLPELNEDAEVTDLIELFPKIYRTNKRTSSTAFMFTGEYGCGKKTADKFFSGELYNMLEDTADSDEELEEGLRYYWINCAEFMYGSKSEICSNINDLFDALSSMLTNECGMETLVYVSFGDVTEIFEHKKTAECFAGRVVKLMNTSDIMCILTCCFEGTASSIRNRYKMPFVVYELEAPDAHSRKIYFEKLKNKYKNIMPETDPSEISDLTEDFTFDMLERVKTMMLMVAKGKAAAGDTEWSHYIYNIPMPDEKKIKLDADLIGSIIKNVERSAFAPKIENTAPAPVYNVQPQFIPVQMQTQQVAEQKNAEEKSDESTDISEPDSFSDLMAIRNNIVSGIDYKPENYDKVMEERRRKNEKQSVPENVSEEEVEEQSEAMIMEN